MTTRLLDPAHSLSEGLSRAIDLTLGGQQGVKRDGANWVSHSLYTKQKVIPVLIAAPGAFRYLPDGESRVKHLKALIELHSKSIVGLNSSLTVEFGETPVNNSGEMMETPTKVSRERSIPVHTYDELYGKPITTFFQDWIRLLIQDEESGSPGITALAAWQEAGSPPLLADMISATILYYEPNVERTGIVSAWLVSNAMPKGVTEEGSRVIGEVNETLELEIELTSLTMVGKAVNELASAHLASLNSDGLNVNAMTLMASEIDPDVASADIGYVNGQDELAAALT